MKRKREVTDWSELVYDALGLIASKLELPDYLRFGAVCKDWQYVAKAKWYPSAQQLPWLILEEDEDTKKRLFFNLSEGKHYYIDIPELHGHICRGSSYGWLFTVNRDLDGHLHNPFTNEYIKLPPFPQYNETTTLSDLKMLQGAAKLKRQQTIVRKAILSGNPSKTRDFMLVILYCGPPTVAFWRPSDPDWTVVKHRFGWTVDMAFFNGDLYALAANLELMVVDTGINPKMRLIQPKVPLLEGCYDAYSVDFAKEFLVLIQRVQEEVEDDHYLTEKLHVFKLHLKEGKWCTWDSIDGSAFFVGSNSCVTVDDPGRFLGCKQNCIYFTGHTHEQFSDEKFGLDDNGFYDVVNGTVGRYYPTDRFVPSGASLVWFTPNPW